MLVSAEASLSRIVGRLSSKPHLFVVRALSARPKPGLPGSNSSPTASPAQLERVATSEHPLRLQGEIFAVPSGQFPRASRQYIVAREDNKTVDELQRLRDRLAKLLVFYGTDFFLQSPTSSETVPSCRTRRTEPDPTLPIFAVLRALMRDMIRHSGEKLQMEDI